MKFVRFAILGVLLGAALGAQGGPTHYVFAHYMVCFNTYGDDKTIEGFKREITQAQAAGLDGFALNVGAWENGGSDWYYKSRVELLYKAAESLGTGFNFFFSVDMPDTNKIVSMVSSYASRPNTFRQRGKVVLSTSGQNNVDWKNGVFVPLKAQGIDVLFVPYFLPDGSVKRPTASAYAVATLNQYSNILDGLFWFAAGLPSYITQQNSGYGTACQTAGKIFMAGYSPTYWGYWQYSNGRAYYESQGGEGTDAQWQQIIALKPDWVEIVTWNDFHESTYVSPVDDPGKYFVDLVSPIRNSHAGYLEMSKRYITWLKTGRNPSITQDALYFFYRTHPKDAVSTTTNETPITIRKGDVEDVIYTTTFLTSPASLEITSGTLKTTNSLLAGMTHTRTPFAPGTQQFTLRRSGMVVLTTNGPPIVAVPTVYNFFSASGYAYGPALVQPPSQLKAANP